MVIQMEFALKKDTNEIVHISDVVSGLACRCYCAACNDDLIARKGEIKRHHFAHRSKDCEYGRETALHLVAKQLIEKNGMIWIPPSEIKCFRGKYDIDRTGTICPDKIYIEKHGFRGFIPDICIEYGSEKLLIEIYVTHPIDSVKKEKIEKEIKELSCIEINLSSFKDAMISRDLLYYILTSKSKYIYWIRDNWAINIDKFLFKSSQKLVKDWKQESNKKRKTPLNSYEYFESYKPIVSPKYCFINKFPEYVRCNECCFNCHYCLSINKTTVLCVSEIGPLNYKNLNKKLELEENSNSILFDGI